jgi:Flp pilus assembly protein CpaB
MAEPTQGVQNKWLLIIALALALIVVFLYNAHIRAIRAEREGDTISVVALQKAVAANEPLTSRHIVKAVIPKDPQNEYKKIVPWDQRSSLTVGGEGKPVNRSIRKGEYLRWDDIYRTGGEKASDRLGDRMVAIPIEFEQDQSLGDLLAPGDVVNLKGVFPAPGGTYRSFRILSDVRVMNVGGRGGEETRSARSGAANYRRITIEVSPDVSLKLSNLLTHMIGPMQIELKRTESIVPTDAGKINPELENLAVQARAPGRGGSAVPATPTLPTPPTPAK